MSLGFYGGRPLIPQGMVPVMVPGSNASLLGSPPGQVRPLLGQQVQAMGVQPGAALPPGVMQPGLLGQAPPPMMGARMPVAGQMIIPGQEEAMPVTTMAGLDAMKQEPVDPSPEDLADTPIPISAPAAAAGTPQVPLATPHSMMAMSAGSPPVVGQSPLQHGLPTSVQSFQGALPTSVHSLHSALQAGTVQPIMAQGALPASVHSVVGQHGTIPGSLFSQAMGGAMSMGSVQSVMNPGAIPGMMPGQPALPTGVPGFIPGAGPLVTMGMGLQPQMVGGALPAGMALPPGYATSMEAAYKNLGEASLIKQEEFEYEEPPPVIDESNPPAVLDAFNSDLNLKIEPDGLTAESVTDPMGFCFCWAGARAAYGVTSGKACFEVKITKHLTVDFGEEHKEQDPHVMRLGWAVDSASFQLGEVAESYGYGGTGRFSVNMKFKNYGNVFGKGDVITALLDLNPRNPTISFCKNGTHMGIAQKLKSCETPGLFPAILLKNVRVECNFGQRPPWFQPPEGYSFIDHMMAEQKVRGMQAPERQQDCELIMIVGLPGAGKTTWGIKMQEENFEKRYNIIGTDTLIEKMRVNGLPRKNNYHGRWEVLISKATACLNTLFSIGSKLSRNYILDQTNVYASARRRKLRNFYNFKKILAVIQPDDDELKRREYKRTYEDGKFVPEDAVNEMKSNFTLPSDGDEYVDEIRWVELDMKSCLPLVDMYNRVKGPRNDSGRGRGRGGRGGYGGGGHDNRKRYGDHGDNRSGQQGYGPPGEKKMRQDGDRSGLDYIKQEYDDKGNSGESQASGQWSHDAGSRPPGDGYGNSYNRSYGGSSGQQNWNQSGLKPGESPWGQDGNQAQSTWQQQRDQGPRWQQGESPNISGSLLGAPPPPPPQGTDRGGRYDDSGRSGPYSKEDSKSYRDDRRSGQYRDDKSWDRRGGSNDRSSSGRYQSGGDRGDSSRGSSGGGSSSWQQRKPWEKQEEGSDRRGDKESGSRYSREDRGRGEGRSDSYRSQGGGSSSGGQWNQSGDSRRDRGYGSPDGDQPPPPPKEESSRDSRGGGYGRDERSGAYGGYNERGRGDDRGGSWSSSSKQSGGRDEGRHESRSDYGKQYGSSGGSQQHGGRYGSDSKDKEQRYDSYYDDHNGDDSARDKKERKSRWDTNEGEGGEENKSSSSGGVKEEPAAAKQPEDRQSGINQQQQKGPSVESSPTQQGNAENIQQNIQDGGNSGPGLLGQYGGPPVIGKAQPMGNMQELIQRPPPSMGGPGGGPGGPPQFGGGGHFQNQPAMMRGPPPPSLMNAPPPHRGGGMMNNPDRFPHPGGGPPPGFGGRGGFQGGRGQGPMHGGRGGGFRGRGFGGPRGGGYGGPPRGGGGFHRGGRGGMF